MRFGGGYVGPDGGYGHVWDIPASVVHDRGLENVVMTLGFVQGSF